MQDFSKAHSTASSHFYNGSKKGASLQKTEPQQQNKQECYFQNTFYQCVSASLPNIDKCDNALQSKVGNLAIELQRVKQLNNSFLSLQGQFGNQTNIEQSFLQNMRQYQNTEVFLNNKQKQMKVNITGYISETEKQICERIKNKSLLQKAILNQIQQETANLKHSKSRCIDQIKKQGDLKYKRMMNQIANLKRQMKQYKQQSSQYKNQIFDNLNSIRVRLFNKIGQQQQKRQSCDEILQKLLKKSSQKAQQSLRRKIGS